MCNSTCWLRGNSIKTIYLSIYLSKVRPNNKTVAAYCCSHCQVYTRIASFKIKCRRVSLRCILAYILRVDFAIHRKRCFVSNKQALQAVFAPTAFVKPSGEVQSTCKVACQQLVSRMHSVYGYHLISSLVIRLKLVTCVAIYGKCKSRIRLLFFVSRSAEVRLRHKYTDWLQFPV